MNYRITTIIRPVLCQSVASHSLRTHSHAFLLARTRSGLSLGSGLSSLIGPWMQHHWGARRRAAGNEWVVQQMGRGQSAQIRSARQRVPLPASSERPARWSGINADTSTRPARARAARVGERSAWCVWGTGSLWKSTTARGRGTPGPRLERMSLLKQRGRELERFDGLSLIYWYVNVFAFKEEFITSWWSCQWSLCTNRNRAQAHCSHHHRALTVPLSYSLCSVLTSISFFSNYNVEVVFICPGNAWWCWWGWHAGQLEAGLFIRLFVYFNSAHTYFKCLNATTTQDTPSGSSCCRSTCFSASEADEAHSSFTVTAICAAGEVLLAFYIFIKNTR